jgi:membrane-bound lytic murein transglycosylase B
MAGRSCVLRRSMSQDTDCSPIVRSAMACVKLAAACGMFLLLGLPLPSHAATDFATWLQGVRTEAVGLGLDEGTLDKALAGLKPIPRVIELDRRQPEFTLTFKQYLQRVVNARRVKIGKQRLAEHRQLLERIAKKYKVQPRFMVALWGIETDFGRITGGFPVIASLATLAYDGRRSKFFRKELMVALRIVDQGHIASDKMIGSWAGAMGQNQFMPSSFQAYAVDYDDDGQKDIWGTLPDIFASIANYLTKSGWRDDQTWGRPAMVPEGFDVKLIGRNLTKELAEWQSLGVRQGDGADLPRRNLSASIISPQKNSLRPAFIAYHNYQVILRWNRSDYFAIAVGTLADRLRQ